MISLESYPDTWVMLRPAAAYSRLANTTEIPHTWRRSLARPLMAASILGCAISLATSGRITLRLAIPATLYWTFIPLFSIASLWLVARADCRKIGWPRAIDLFSTGNAPWLLMTLCYTSFWTFFPAPAAFASVGNSLWIPAALWFTLAWSAWIDFCFFRFALARPPARALRDLALHRLISWPAILAWFVGPAAVQVVATRLGL